VEQLLGLVEVTCVDGDEAEPGEGMDHHVAARRGRDSQAEHMFEMETKPGAGAPQ